MFGMMSRDERTQSLLPELEACATRGLSSAISTTEYPPHSRLCAEHEDTVLV